MARNALAHEPSLEKERQTNRLTETECGLIERNLAPALTQIQITTKKKTRHCSQLMLLISVTQSHDARSECQIHGQESSSYVIENTISLHYKNTALKAV
jgi:hypothetical protein